MFSINALRRIIELLRSRGVDGVIIGSTSLELATGSRVFEGDVDLLVTSTSVLANYSVLEELAREHGCILGATWLGTPSITCFVENEEVPVDLYENIYDFYIPEELVKDSVIYNVSGVKIRAVRPEDYIVLKAVAGREEDLEALRRVGDLIKSRKLKVDKRFIESRTRLFVETQAILRRIGDYIYL